jgi:hypothetical protein
MTTIKLTIAKFVTGREQHSRTHRRTRTILIIQKQQSTKPSTTQTVRSPLNLIIPSTRDSRDTAIMTIKGSLEYQAVGIILALA